MATAPIPEVQYYHHGRFRVAGGILPDAVTAYQTYGNPANPCIVFPTCYGAQLRLGSQCFHVGEDKALDPTKYYIVTFALFCNGESSSPSNTPVPYNGPYFPYVSYEDNTRAQYTVLTKHLGVSKVYCAIGFSMGGQQAYHWAVIYPEFVENIVVICSAARTSPHNKCMLEGPKYAMKAGKDFNDGHYTSTPQHSLRAFGRVFSAWVYGQAWFRQHLYEKGGLYPNLESYLREESETNNLVNWDANDLLALLLTWQNGDVSQVRDDGNFEQCLGSIKAKTLLLPSKTDLLFCPEDSEIELSLLPDAQLCIINSIWGHVAGGEGNPEDIEFVATRVREFLQ